MPTCRNCHPVFEQIPKLADIFMYYSTNDSAFSCDTHFHLCQMFHVSATKVEQFLQCFVLEVENVIPLVDQILRNTMDKHSGSLVATWPSFFDLFARKYDGLARVEGFARRALEAKVSIWRREFCR